MLDVRRWLRRGLNTLGAALLLAWVGLTLDARGFENGLGRRFESIRRRAVSAPWSDSSRATRREALATGLIGRLEVPRLGISAMVVEGAGGSALRHAVGHVEGTAFPGERGNVGIAGHRDTHFRNLKDVSRGDRIRLDTPDGAFDYVVDSVLIVTPDRADLLGDSNDARLTMVTCYPFHWVGPAPKRFVVQARAVGRDEPVAGR